MIRGTILALLWLLLHRLYLKECGEVRCCQRRCVDTEQNSRPGDSSGVVPIIGPGDTYSSDWL